MEECSTTFGCANPSRQYSFFWKKKHKIRIRFGYIGNDPNHIFLLRNDLYESFFTHYLHILNEEISDFPIDTPVSEIFLHSKCFFQLTFIDKPMCKEHLSHLHGISFTVREKKKFFSIDEVECYENFS